MVRVRQKCWDWKDGERTVRRAKSGETLVEASRDTNAQIVRYSCFMGAKDKSNHLADAHMLKSMCACCRHTRGRFESTHGKRFESTHGVLSVPHHTAHTTPHHTTQHHTNTHDDTHTTNTRRQRQRKKTEKEDRERKEKRRDEKRREEEMKKMMKKKTEREEKTKDKMKNKKIMMWTDAEKGVH